MNKAQYSLLAKEFPIKGTNRTISRGFYESLPDAMMAWDWNDEKMQRLADNISVMLSTYYDPINLFEEDGNEEEREDWENTFFRCSEEAAVNMGMIYYEDLTDEEFEKQRNEWELINEN